jgi:uncharacterized repeat protein (TIGR03803 family)
MRKAFGFNQTSSEAHKAPAKPKGRIAKSRFRSALLPYAIMICVTAAATPAHAQTITQLFSFPCPSTQQITTCPQGYAPNKLIQASDGNFYGAAQLSTIGTSESHGGTLFQITPAGHFTLLFTFRADSNGKYVNGDNPATALVEANDGFLYGTSFEGGAHNAGVLFRISKTGTGFQVLHDFCSSANCVDGNDPQGMILGHDGNLYGVTIAGGTTTVPGGAGTIFRFSPSSGFNTVFEFDGTTAAYPLGLTQGTDGKFYVVTANAVVRFTLPGQLTVMQTFPPADNILPSHGADRLVQAKNGKLYGGISAYSLNQLQFYEINPSGNGFLEFPSLGNLLGANGIPGLIEASDGNLWDAVPNTNSVFAVSPTTGLMVKSFEFTGNNGGFPDAPVLQGADGKIYGTAIQGGAVAAGKQASGTIWSLDAGLRAPAPVVAAFTPLIGAVGSTVMIRGSHFVGTTAVTFNGVNAAFKILNTNFISATVPASATTGPIAVTCAGGTTVSSGHFTVQ